MSVSIDKPSPEGAFIGALLCLAAAPAHIAVQLVEPDDIWDPRFKLIHGLIADLTARGVTPDPVLVLGEARRTGRVTGAESLRRLGNVLHELYGACPTPLAVSHYGALVLEDTYRRRLKMLGARIAQAAEESATDDLAELLASEVSAVDALYTRLCRTSAGIAVAAA